MGPKVEESEISKIMEYFKKLEAQRVKDKEELEKARREELEKLEAKETAREDARREEFEKKKRLEKKS